MLIIPPIEKLIIKYDKRYSNVIRSPSDNQIIGYLEGNKSWYDMFNGETFFKNPKGTVFTMFQDHNQQWERMNITEIDLTGYELIEYTKEKKVVRRYGLISVPEKSPKEKKINYPDKRKTNVYEVTTPNGNIEVVTDLKEYCIKHDLLLNKASEAAKHGKKYKGYSIDKITS